MSDPVRDAALRAYERGRVLRALPWALPVGLLTVGAVLGGSHAAVAIGAALAAGVVALLWWGGEPGRGGLAGLLAGTVPYAVMLAWIRYGDCTPTTCCVVSGLSGLGGTLALISGLRAGTRPWTAAALAVAAGTAMLPCWKLGAPGLLAAAVLVATAVPVAVLGRPAVRGG